MEFHGKIVINDQMRGSFLLSECQQSFVFYRTFHAYLMTLRRTNFK